MGDYGPDAGAGDPNRGPQGSVEFNIIKQPGNYGWPYCVRENVPYNDIRTSPPARQGRSTTARRRSTTRPTTRASPTCRRPSRPRCGCLLRRHVDDRASRASAPAAPRPAARATTSTGPRVRHEVPASSSTASGSSASGTTAGSDRHDERGGPRRQRRPPDALRGHIQPDGHGVRARRLALRRRVGPGFTENNPDSGIYRIDYTKGARQPVAHATATPDSGTLPLEVPFSIGRLDRPRRARRSPTRGTSTATVTPTPPTANPTHTYTTAGTFTAKLTVTDSPAPPASTTSRSSPATRGRRS